MISQARSAPFSVLMISSRPPTGSSRTPPVAATHPPSLASARRRMFAQQESNCRWVLLLVDRGAHTRSSSGALAHLHVCSTRRADFAYLSSSLACKCESEDFRPMRGVYLPHGAYFESESDRTTEVRSSSGMSVQPDIPTFVSVPPPLQDGGLLAHAEV